MYIVTSPFRRCSEGTSFEQDVIEPRSNPDGTVRLSTGCEIVTCMCIYVYSDIYSYILSLFTQFAPNLYHDENLVRNWSYNFVRNDRALLPICLH